MKLTLQKKLIIKVQLKFKSHQTNKLNHQKLMDSSGSKCSKSKNKNWNIFRSPQQKDLFDFLDRSDDKSFNQNQSEKDKNLKQSKNHHNQTKIFNNKDEIQQQSFQDDIFMNTQRSNMTFATRYQGQDSNKVLSGKGQLFFKAPSNKNKQKISQFQQQQQPLTSRLKEQDSFSNIFLNQLRTQQHQNLSADPGKRKLFQNVTLKTSNNVDFHYVDQEMILKTLNQIKEINKENLFVNKKILFTMLETIKTGKSTKREKNKSNPLGKQTEKKQYNQKNLHQKGFSQSRKDFYLYEKALKPSSHSKLSHNKSTIIKKSMLNTTNNVTKLSLNQNTTKLSLGDRTQASIKRNPHSQSKSTIKKSHGQKRISNLILDDNFPSKMSEINKIKTSLNIFMKQNTQNFEKLLPKTSNKKKSKSQFMLRC